MAVTSQAGRIGVSPYFQSHQNIAKFQLTCLLQGLTVRAISGRDGNDEDAERIGRQGGRLYHGGHRLRLLPDSAGAVARRNEGGRVLRILLVEDDQRLSEVITEALRRSGWAVDAVGSCAEAYAALRIAQYKAMALDLALPDGDGLNLVQSLRTVGDALPILILTARGRVSDRIKGLNAGADDYVVKPFETAELHARLVALTRRAAGYAEPMLRFGLLEFDQGSRTATYDGKPLRLTLRPAMILQTLMQANGRFVARTAIENAISSFDGGPESGAVEVYINRLRKCLKELAPEVRIENQRGIGYRIGIGPDA